MKHDTEAFKNEATGDIHVKGRMLWPTLLEPKTSRMFPESGAKFSSGLLIPKSVNIDAIKADIERIGVEVHGKEWRKKGLHICLRATKDNDKLVELAEAFPYLLNSTANADFPPFVFGPDAKQFKGDATDIYGGRWAVIAGSAWGSKKGKGNIGWNLNRIQLLDHDEPVGGGRVATAEGFEAVDVPASSAGAATGSADDMWA